MYYVAIFCVEFSVDASRVYMYIEYPFNRVCINDNLCANSGEMIV